MSTRRDEILRWPLWSWRNFTVTAAAVLLLLAGLGRVVNAAPITTHHASVATTTAGPSSTLPPQPTGTQVVTGSRTKPSNVQTDAAAASDPAATRVAASFVRAWANPELDQGTWLHGIQPFLAPSLAKALSSTDPAQVPASAVTGEPRLVRVTATSSVINVPTDGGPVAVTLRGSAGRWKVTDIEPAEQAPAAPTPALTPSTAGH
ncbi:MAG TPA: hypothetical protein VFK66_00480 [Oryzihumus sp.]|nr:hypothetical protein [Oryzihumus sp.]